MNTETKLTFVVQERAVTYARVSYDDRDTDGRNLQGQLDMGQEHSQKKSYRVVAELAEDDKGASGAAIDLPQLNRIREMAQAKQFDVLVVRELDRLSRNLAKQLIIEEELKRAGVRVEYVLTEYDDTPEGRLQKHIKATVAEYEREKINERMNRGKRNAVKAGNVLVANRPPYGYCVVMVGKARTFEIVETEARIIRLIFSWYVEEGIAMYAIAQRLSEMGVPTFSETGKRSNVAPKKVNSFGQWGRDAIWRILSSEVYCGVWRHGKRRRVGKKWVNNSLDQIISVKVPDIVSRVVWEAAQVKMQVNKEQAKRNTKSDYLLARRVTCGCCYRKMVGQPSKSRVKTYLYYACQFCKRPFFRADYVDHIILQWLEEILSSPQKVWEAIETHKRNRDMILAPLLRRFEIIEDLIRQHGQDLQEQLDNLNDLEKRKAERSKAITLNAIERIEQTLNGLDVQKQEALAKIKEEEQDDGLGTILQTHSLNLDDYPTQVMEITVEGQTVSDKRAKLKASSREVIVLAGDISEARLISGSESTTKDGWQERAITIYTWEEALKLHQQEFEEERKTFEGHRRLIEKYDIRVTLTVENGQKFVNVRGKLGEAHLPIALDITSGILT